jgi:hypothetical protein
MSATDIAQEHAATRGRTVGAVARLAPAARMCALAGLTWTMQACCCGSPTGGFTPPTAGPPGTITGQIFRPFNDPPTGLEVYALEGVSLYYQRPLLYAATHVPATASSYSLTLPAAGYLVVARLDGELLRGGGATYFTKCALRADCDQSKAGHSVLVAVQVESGKLVSGVNIGDWGQLNIEPIFWNIDTNGSPLPEQPWLPPTPQSLPIRSLTSAPSTGPTAGFTSSYLGVTLQMPIDWAQVKPPKSIAYFSFSLGVYFANERVSTPLALDGTGIWLTIRNDGSGGCLGPDWRYATSRTTVTIQGSGTDFAFEDPPPRDGPQPFVGYTVRGCAFSFGGYVEFILTGASKDAFEHNLDAFLGMIEGAQFVAPGPHTGD